MTVASILTTLRSERDRLDKAIAALEGIEEEKNGRPTKRSLSVEGRARIIASQRKRWAKFRKGKKKK